MIDHPLALLLRADASTQIGTGHVMRCLALAQAWQDAGGQAHFAAVELPDGLIARLAAEGMTLHRLDVAPGSPEDAAQTAVLARQLGAAWVVDDGYHFGTDYQRAIKEASLRLLAIDDYGHADNYVADLVLNQNIHALRVSYSAEPYTRLLLGSQYVQLRREFRLWHHSHREIPGIASRILVTLGGSDPENHTGKVIDAVCKMHVKNLKVVIVVGSSNSHKNELELQVRNSVTHPVRLVQNITNMPEFMAWADVAVSSGGGTCWELAFMGLPAIVGQMSQVEDLLVSGLKEKRLFLHAGWFSNVSAMDLADLLHAYLYDAKLRAHMSVLGRNTIDGLGTDRILEAISAVEQE